MDAKAASQTCERIGLVRDRPAGGVCAIAVDTNDIDPKVEKEP
jgi:hypothetical protein